MLSVAVNRQPRERKAAGVRTNPADRSQSTHIADLVGELQDLGAARLPKRLFDLEALAFFGREVLVIGYFRYKCGYVVAEAPRDLIPVDALIFDRIMEEPRDDEVRVPSVCRLRDE